MPRTYCTLITTITYMFLPSICQAGGIFGVGALPPCSNPSSINIILSDGMCVPDGSGNTSGRFAFGESQRWGPSSIDSQFTNIGWFYSTYVPYSGYWKFGIALCPGTGKCSLGKASVKMLSIKEMYIRSTQSIASQYLSAGGYPAYTQPQVMSACTFLYSIEDSQMWSSRDTTSCTDGHRLPQEPAACLINYGESLNVDLGRMERSSISTAPGTSKAIKKTIPVMCTGDAALTVSMQLQYTPISVGGDQIVKSSTEGLGVAIQYNGKVVKPTDSQILSFPPGISNLDLEFEAIRDPNVALGDIATGAFTANAVLMMTEQ